MATGATGNSGRATLIIEIELLQIAGAK